MQENNDPLGILGGLQEISAKENDPLGLLGTPPEKKSPIGSSTQGLQGLGGSSGGNLPSPLSASATEPETPFIGAGRLESIKESTEPKPAPKKGLVVPPTPVVGLGGEEPKEPVTYAQKVASQIVDESVSNAMNPPADPGTYVLDGKKISKAKAKEYSNDRSFMETLKERPERFQVYEDYAFQKHVERQMKSLDNPDWMESLAAGAAEGLKMGAGAAEYFNDLLSEVTDVPNFLYTTISLAGRTGSPEQMSKTIGDAAISSIDTDKSVRGAMQKFAEDAEFLRNQRFQIEDTFIDQLRNNPTEAVNTAVNTAFESAVPSLLIGLGAAVTGGTATGGALVTPLFVGGEYAEQELSEDQSLKNLTATQRFSRPLLRGTAEMAGEAVSFGILKGTTKVATETMKSLVGKTATELGAEAAKEVAQEGGKEIAKRLLLSVGVNPLLEGFSELSTYAAQELTDVVMGISNKSPEQIIEEAKNTFALGAASGQVMTAPATSTTAVSAANQARKKLLDYTIAFDPKGVDDLNAAAQQYAQRTGQSEEIIKENIAKREKAVNAVPKDMVEDTEAVDLVEEKQAKKEQAKGLDPIFAAPIEEEIADIDAKLSKKVRKEYPAPTVNTTPTEKRYASVNRNDGKGDVDLTQEEYLAEMERRGTPVEIPAEGGTSKENKQTQAEPVKKVETEAVSESQSNKDSVLEFERDKWRQQKDPNDFSDPKDYVVSFIEGLTGTKDTRPGTSKYFGTGKLVNGKPVEIRVSDHRHSSDNQKDGDYLVSIIVNSGDPDGITIRDDYSEIRISGTQKNIDDKTSELEDFFDDINQSFIEKQKPTKEENSQGVTETEPQTKSREEMLTEYSKLAEEFERLADDFDPAAMKVKAQMDELAASIPEAEAIQEEPLTEEELNARDEAMRQEAASNKGAAFEELQSAFSPISIADYERAMGKGMYKENKKFLTGLVTAKASEPIDTRQRPSNQMETVDYFDSEEIIDFINTVASERVEKGFTEYKIPKERKFKEKAAKEPSVAGKKVSTGDFLRDLAKKVGEGKMGNDVAMSSFPGFKQAFNAAVTAAEKTLEGTAYVSDIIDYIIEHVRNSPQFKNLRPAQRKAFNLKGTVLSEMGMDNDAYNEIQIKDIKAKAKKSQVEAVKETRKEEKAKADVRVEKTKVASEKKVDKAKDETKQKYVNVGYRIGEAFGKLGGEIRGKAEGRKEGRKEAGAIQREFAKQVEGIILEAINEAKVKSPGFTVSPNQLAAATKKLLSVNFNSPLSIEKAVEYADKVLNNATYANDIARTKKLKSVNTKRLGRNDFGIDDGSMSQALKVDHEQLSPEQLAEYMEFLTTISQGPYNKAANIDNVNKYAEMYREQKAEAQEPISEAQEEANEKRELSRNEAKQEAIDEFEFERRSMSAPVSEAYQKDYTFLKSLTEAELDALSEKKLMELSNAIRNMRDDIGFMSGNASNTIRELRAERIADEGKQITEGRGFKQLLRDLILPMKISFKGIEKMTPTDKMKRLISMMPLNRIDAAMKGVTGQSIHDTFVQPISTAFSVFSEKMTQLDKGYDRLYSKVGKSLIPWKREQQRQDEMVKLSLIAIQKEYEANPNNEEVSPLSDYMDAIREAAVVNDDYAKFAEKYIAIYESMLDSNGNFDYVKQEELLDKDTKAFYDYTQAVNAENTPFVEVSAIRNGENVSLRQSYTPISVALIDYSNLSEVQNMASQFSSDENVKPTAQSGNIKKRTKGGKPLYLDFHRNAKKATRSVLLDYYMREPLRVASKAFNKISKDPEMSSDSRAFFKGVEANIAQVVKNTFVNEYFEGGLGTMIAETLKKRGYQMALASIPRAGVEFASNMTHAVINKPKELLAGAKILSEYKGNDEDLRTLAIFAESAQISRMFERSMSIMSEQGSNTKGSSSAYGRAIDQAADAIMSTPDRAIARPVWLGSFARTFEQASGSPLDIQEMISNPEYRQTNAAAIASARNVADVNLSQGFASMNPFEGVVASQVTKSDGMIDTFDKYMTRFMRYEFQSAADALNGLVGRNELTRKQATALLAATMLRMASYQFAMSYAIDGFYSLIESATGTGPDEDEEDNEGLSQKIGSALLGTVISMLVFRRLGNWAKAPIAWGIETLNNKFGEEAGLRNGEYDSFKNSLVFSPIAGDIQGSDMNSDKLIPKFMGPYGPMAKTALRAKELLGRTGVQDGMGGYLIEPTLKSQDAIDKANNELAVRIVPELFMQSIGAPVPRDIRNLIIRDVFKDFKEGKGSSEKALTETQKAVKEELTAYKESVLSNFSKKVGNRYATTDDSQKLPIETIRSGYRAKFNEKYKAAFGKDIESMSRKDIMDKHNIEVFKSKEKDLSEIFISTDGEGTSLMEPFNAAAKFYDSNKVPLSAQQEKSLKEFLGSMKKTQYLSDFKEQLNTQIDNSK